MSQKLSKRSVDRLGGVKPSIVKIFIEACPTSPYDYGIPRGGGLRSDEDQIDMYAIGRTTQLHREPVTWTLNSKHKAKEDGYGHAVDIYAYINGKPTWNMKYIRPIAKHVIKFAWIEYGIILYWGFALWGKDGAHFQDVKE